MAVGPWQVVAILVIIVLLFGAKKIPELAQGIGKSIKIFKKEVENDDKTGEENKEKIEKKDEKQ
ncbi:twin-arginine translocase TatA/TatE family subunit [Campylobacter hominis]|uniref:Sec-independent protein translocase protein TatA n=1 Tax=Campylobacter hominis (strain ATCC BAA-381 / DSM 21671 / CCUG 45161 / LMG 19568 / NCTC 13146 / CH001A) TaxID=360107 RepID=A7I2R2_CAMHC|nr:twin-arginine translocase TatA/TatE family subunit [Campylobacter hominis]ABS50991.1 twin argininte translocase protein A [Campylobacter hominis ATCC BAA-381]UAK85949.1 twin-arginine translocase TatA/TatE family subunit [Campylobacter hominis]SUW85323.1 twin argininte translocase protein A [Campylobacter hominis]